MSDMDRILGVLSFMLFLVSLCALFIGALYLASSGYRFFRSKAWSEMSSEWRQKHLSKNNGIKRY